MITIRASVSGHCSAGAMMHHNPACCRPGSVHSPFCLTDTHSARLVPSYIPDTTTSCLHPAAKRPGFPPGETPQVFQLLAPRDTFPVFATAVHPPRSGRHGMQVECCKLHGRTGEHQHPSAVGCWALLCMAACTWLPVRDEAGVVQAAFTGWPQPVALLLARWDEHRTSTTSAAPH